MLFRSINWSLRWVYHAHKVTTHNPIAFANFKKPSSDKTPGELRPDIMTYFFHTQRERICHERKWSTSGGRDFHVERLAEPIERTVDKRTASESGVDKRYSSILSGPEGEGAFEAKQGHKKEANHEEDRRGGSRGIHTIDKRRPL